MAQAAAIPVSFDCNYRPGLWQGRLAEARRELAAGLSVATVAFADARVLALVMGDAAPRSGEEVFARLARKAFSRYPGLQQIAATSRLEQSANRHELRGMLATREGIITSGPLVAEPIVDRIGTGDAFAAALLLAMLERLPPRRHSPGRCCLRAEAFIPGRLQPGHAHRDRGARRRQVGRHPALMPTSLNAALGESLKRWRILPVVKVDDVAQGLAVAQACLRGGLSAIEITLRTQAALDVIAAVASRLPAISVGAGSVMEAGQMAAAQRAGAAFAVSPGNLPELFEAADSLAMPWLPGAATASEILYARRAGYRVLKFFPA